MNQSAKLILLCGKMGAGKSSLAKTLCEAGGAVLVCEDDWLQSHYPSEINSFDDYLKFSRRIKPFVKTLVQQMLVAGIDVVMDFPANTRTQRSSLLSIANDVNCPHELYYLNVNDQTCLLQLAVRRKQQPHRSHFDTPEVFQQVSAYFEEPMDDEHLNVIDASS